MLYETRNSGLEIPPLTKPLHFHASDYISSLCQGSQQQRADNSYKGHLSRPEVITISVSTEPFGQLFSLVTFA